MILTYWPYANGVAFQVGWPDQWHRMVSEHPDVEAGSSDRFQTRAIVDPEKWVPEGYACVGVDSRGAGCSSGYIFDGITTLQAPGTALVRFISR